MKRIEDIQSPSGSVAWTQEAVAALEERLAACEETPTDDKTTVALSNLSAQVADIQQRLKKLETAKPAPVAEAPKEKAAAKAEEPKT
jgi:hypothetical protein